MNSLQNYFSAVSNRLEYCSQGYKYSFYYRYKYDNSGHICKHFYVVTNNNMSDPKHANKAVAEYLKSIGNDFVQDPQLDRLVDQK